MANIRLLNGLNNTSFEPGSILDVSFSIKGNINTVSSLFTLRAKYVHNGETKYLEGYNYQVVDGNSITDITSIPSTGYSGKEYRMKLLTPVSTDLDGGNLIFSLEVIGNDANENDGQLEVQSEKISLSGKLSSNFITKAYPTKEMVTSIKVKLNKEDHLHDGIPMKYTVKATNNAYDKSPVWEDITVAFNKGEFASLTNNICDSGRNGVRVEVIIEKTNYKSYVKIYEVILGFM